MAQGLASRSSHGTGTVAAIQRLLYETDDSNLIPVLQPDFVAEDDSFLDSLEEMLHELAFRCHTAWDWSEDSDRVLDAVANAFDGLQSICIDAGLAIPAAAHGFRPQDSTEASGLVSSSDSIHAYEEEGLLPLIQPQDTELDEEYQPGRMQRERTPSEQSSPAMLALPGDEYEEIVELEITDLVMDTHEKIQNCQRQFEQCMADAERMSQDRDQRQSQEIQALHQALLLSQSTVASMQTDLATTKTSMEALHAMVAESKTTLEAGLKKQSAFWKSVCQDLITEKRGMAQKLAEERGRCVSLREYLASHEDHTLHEDESSSMSSERVAEPVAPLKNLPSCGDQSSDRYRALEIDSLGRANSVHSTDWSDATSTKSYAVDKQPQRQPSCSNSSSSSRGLGPLDTQSVSSARTTASSAKKPTFRRYYLAKHH